MGNYIWAINRLKNGSRVRRSHWPIHSFKRGDFLGESGGTREYAQKDFTSVWHLFTHDYTPTNEEDNERFLWCLFVGWGSSIGAFHDEKSFNFEGFCDGVNYSFSDNDMYAKDWEVVTFPYVTNSRR